VPWCRASMQKLMVRAPASSAFCGVYVTSERMRNDRMRPSTESCVWDGKEGVHAVLH